MNLFFVCLLLLLLTDPFLESINVLIPFSLEYILDNLGKFQGINEGYNI